MDKLIRDKAITTISNVAKWKFIPRGKLCLIRNHEYIDTNVYTGIMKYNNDGYEFGYAIRIDNWATAWEPL